MEDENNLQPNDPNRVDPSENTQAEPPDLGSAANEEEEDEGGEQ